MSGTEIIEIALRGGAATLCLVKMYMLLLHGRGHIAAIAGAIFSLGAALYIITTIPAVHDALGPLFLPVKFIGMVSPAFFWLFVVALLNDRYQWRWAHAAPIAVLAALFPFCGNLSPALLPAEVQQTAEYVRLVFVLGLMVHALLLTRRSLADDLVASRLSFSRTLAVIIPLMSVTIGAVEIYEIVFQRPEGLQPALSLMLFGVAVVYSVHLMSIRSGLFAEQEPPTGNTHGGLSAIERIEAGRLRSLMDEGAYLSPGLTIGSLAHMMELPEHRLRRLINQQLGYRNFATFINDHRINEARRRLADGALAREQITTLAYDLGFASLAPFNRAFRERTGMSPSEYRIKALSEMV